MPLHTLRHRFPLFLLLLCAVMSSAQEKPPSFLIRIADVSLKKQSLMYNCTVLTEDGRLRYEVSPAGGKPTVFEGTASDDDVTRLKELVNDPNFQSAMQHQNQKFKNHRPITVAPPGGRLIAVEVKNVDGKLQTVTFGGTDVPSYLAGLISFTTDVSNRNVANVQGRAESLCRPFGVPPGAPRHW